MEKQERKFNKEKEILQQKMAADAKAHQEQTTNMIKASMQKAEQDRRAMMQANQATKARFEEMEKYNQEMKQENAKLIDLLEKCEKEIKELKEPWFFQKALKKVGDTLKSIPDKCIVM